MNFNIYNSLIFAGIIQGLIFVSVWLSNKKYRSKATLYLILLILSFTLSNLQWFLYDVGVLSRYVFYSYVFIPFALIMPPLLLGYGYLVVNPSKSLSKYFNWLFLPFVIGLVIAIYFKVQVVVFKNELNLSAFYRDLPYVSELISGLSNLAVIIFLFFQIRRKGDKAAQDRWFTKILVTLFFGTLLWIYSEIAFLEEEENYFFYPLWIVVSIIIYWLGHIGIYKYGVQKQRTQLRAFSRSQFYNAEASKKGNEATQKLQQLMTEEKLYLDSQLTLEVCAQRLAMSQGHLSKLINTDLQMSFKDYVNGLRVEEAKSYLNNPEFKNYTLVAIGLEAGFNSKSAFNTSFKKVTGLTPSQFKKELAN